MLAWMVYAVLVAAVFGGAALLAEQAAKHRRLPTRGVWIAAIATSIALPVAMATVSIPRSWVSSEASATAKGAAEPLLLGATTSIPLAAKAIDWSGATSYASSPRIDTMLTDIWLASSCTLLLFLGVTTMVFHRRKRRWTPGTAYGVPVLVSDDVGPAVVGLVRSRVVIPAWVLEESPAQQRYIMAHEQSHLAARDPLLVAVAMALLVSMPWSPLLWWQFHRLRCAIEVDCDARVLREGGDVRDYCETLIQVGQNQSEYVAAVTAMSESKSFLERRIRIMLSTPRKWARASAFAMISLALGMAVFAAQVTPPESPGQPATHAPAVDPAILDTYAGFYALSDYSLLTVERKENGLTVTPIGQFLAQGTIAVSAVGEHEFAVPAIDVTLDFVKGADGRVASVVVREHGNVAIDAPRVDRATAERIRADLAERVKVQKPFPDSEKALRRILTNPEGNEGLDPAAARIFARNHAQVGNYLAHLGPVQSYKFEGVTDYGWDIYDVQHEHGAQQVFIQLDRHGLISNSVMRRQ
ncbi:hypothetical protein HBF26_15710 [Luteibacter jiangsuensis]|uniref:Peptidase M56 domain-containing protein n=1 Tax=Luteibacter jiangsuensis TaxID=637577 RepID=A0ABX0Q711_9GAMM|nr:M56 family metallopeptidase [Luteibacter jiangsuensis]NID06340.1 hypothetical protein [Luteibacter jiangsuensis]